MQQKDNSGVLFKNKDKKTDKHPDAKGNCLIGGQKYWVSAWKNTAKSGVEYTSLLFSIPKPKNESASSPSNDLPF